MPLLTRLKRKPKEPKKKQKDNAQYVVVAKKLNTNNLNYDTLSPKDKIYAAFVTAYKNSESYKNKRMMADMKIAQDKYLLSKDTITLVANYLNQKYGDSDAKVEYIILKPNVAGVISAISDYLPGWHIQPIHPNKEVSRLVPMPTILRCERVVL